MRTEISPKRSLSSAARGPLPSRAVVVAVELSSGFDRDVLGVPPRRKP